MKIAHSLKMFAGSVAVYAVVATAYACGDADKGAKTRGTPATGGGGDGGASGAHGAGGEDSTTESAGVGPVPPAMADPVPGTRLQSRYRVADDGSREWIGWYDTVLDAQCGWLRMSDGKDHCLPSYPQITGRFADPACTRYAVRVEECIGPSNRLMAYRYSATDRCTFEIYVHRLEPLAVGTAIYAKGGATCVPAPSGEVSTESDFVTGAEVPPSEFVASDVVHGP